MNVSTYYEIVGSLFDSGNKDLAEKVVATKKQKRKLSKGQKATLESLRKQKKLLRGKKDPASIRRRKQLTIQIRNLTK